MIPSETRTLEAASIPVFCRDFFTSNAGLPAERKTEMGIDLTMVTAAETARRRTRQQYIDEGFVPHEAVKDDLFQPAELQAMGWVYNGDGYRVGWSAPKKQAKPDPADAVLVRSAKNAIQSILEATDCSLRPLGRRLYGVVVLVLPSGEIKIHIDTDPTMLLPPRKVEG